MFSPESLFTYLQAVEHIPITTKKGGWIVDWPQLKPACAWAVNKIKNLDLCLSEKDEQLREQDKFFTKYYEIIVKQAKKIKYLQKQLDSLPVNTINTLKQLQNENKFLQEDTENDWKTIQEQKNLIEELKQKISELQLRLSNCRHYAKIGLDTNRNDWNDNIDFYRFQLVSVKIEATPPKEK